MAHKMRKYYLLLNEKVATKKDRTLFYHKTGQAPVVQGSLWFTVIHGNAGENTDDSLIADQNLEETNANDVDNDNVSESEQPSQLLLSSVEFEDTELRCSESDVKILTYTQYGLLLALNSCSERYSLFNSSRFWNECVKIQEGSQVYVVSSRHGKGNTAKMSGVIRYMGQVVDRNGIWFGVELDKEFQKRGTSDGSFHNKKYFDAPQNSAVFVPVNCLQLSPEISNGSPRANGSPRKVFQKQQAPSPPLSSSVLSQDTSCETQVTESPLVLGDRVVWISDGGAEHGVVRWIGHLPDSPEKDLTIGVEFDNPVGSGTGKYKDRHLFRAKRDHASLVPILGLLKEDTYICPGRSDEFYQPEHRTTNKAGVSRSSYGTTNSRQVTSRSKYSTLAGKSSRLAPTGGRTYPRKVDDMMEGQRRLLEQYNTNKQPRVSHKNPAPEAPVKPLGPPIPNKLTKGGAEEKSIYEEHPVYENMSSNEDKSNYSDHGDQEVYGEVLFKGKPKELQEENNYETFGEIGTAQNSSGLKTSAASTPGDYKSFPHVDKPIRGSSSDPEKIAVDDHGQCRMNRINSTSHSHEDNRLNQKYVHQSSPVNKDFPDMNPWTTLRALDQTDSNVQIMPKTRSEIKRNASSPHKEMRSDSLVSSKEHRLEEVDKGRKKSYTEPLSGSTSFAELQPLKPSEINFAFEIGSMVEVKDNPADCRFGVVRWLGYFNDRTKPLAGLEMEDEHPACTEGSFGKHKVFSCAPKKAYFTYVHKLKEDSRFLESMRYSDRRDSQVFGSLDCPDVAGNISPPETFGNLAAFIGRYRGVQGHHNSCYMDSTLFSMFAFSTAFDTILYRDKRPNDIPQYEEVQQSLREGIVNPLRQNFFVRADKVLRLRSLLDRLSSVQGLMSEEKDPEEFINSMLQQTLQAEPFIKLSSGQESFLYQLFVEADDKIVLPTTQQLLGLSFLQSDVKLAEIPSCLMLQMPRFGRDFKAYKRIIPSLELDINDILETGPRDCTICGSLATHECKDCYWHFGDGTSLDKIAFCEICLRKSHSHTKRATHKPKKLKLNEDFVNYLQSDRVSERSVPDIPREKLELSAVICIERSHYVAFVKCGLGAENPWVFFDSMADRMGEQHGYNVPEVQDAPLVHEWLLPENHNKIRSYLDDKQLPTQMKRLLCDSYICIYQSPSLVEYR